MVCRPVGAHLALRAERGSSSGASWTLQLCSPDVQLQLVRTALPPVLNACARSSSLDVQ